MKKIVCAMLSIVMLSGCFGSNKEKNTPTEISIEKVVERLQDENKDTFLLYITTNDCYSCDEYAKVVEELEKIKPFEIYYIDIDRQEDDEDVKEALNELEVTIGEYSTYPMTYYFYKGTLQPENIKKGYIEKEDYETWLKNLHIL